MDGLKADYRQCYCDAVSDVLALVGDLLPNNARSAAAMLPFNPVAAVLLLEGELDHPWSETPPWEAPVPPSEGVNFDALLTPDRELAL